MKIEKVGFELKGMKLGQKLKDGGVIVAIEDDNTDFLDVGVLRNYETGDATLEELIAIEEFDDVHCVLEGYMENECIEWMSSHHIIQAELLEEVEIETEDEIADREAREFVSIATAGLTELLHSEICTIREDVEDSGILDCSFDRFIHEYAKKMLEDGVYKNLSAREQYLHAFGFCGAMFINQMMGER